MECILTGQFLRKDFYHSEKKKADIPQALILNGKETVQVDGVPEKWGEGFKMGDPVRIPVRIFAGQYGLRVAYNENFGALDDILDSSQPKKG